MQSTLKNWLKKCRPLVVFIRLIKHAGERSPLVYHCRDYTSNDFVRRLIQILVTPYYMLKWCFPKDYPGREGLAFVLIAKNEALYIKEWLDFHIKQGVSHFIIYDNESTDNFREVLAPYIDSGIVTYNIIRGRRRQLDVYNMALVKYGRRFKYMGFIDADEFVFVRNTADGVGGMNLYEFVDEFMAAHPNAGGLGINWLIFGSNGHIKKPEGGVLENFTMCAEKDFPNNQYQKPICNTSRTFIDLVHGILCFRGFENLTETGEITDGVTKEVHFDKVRINHYFCKSEEEYTTIKMARGDVFFGPTKKKMSAFRHHDRNDVLDTEILSHM